MFIFRHSDPLVASRTWQTVIDEIIKTKTGENQIRWQVMAKWKHFDPLRNRLLIETQWQLFSSFTFKSEKVTNAVRIKMFFALMREQADNFGVHFKKTIWCLRQEAGEATGRLHLHALIAGLPPHAMTTATCFSFMKIWERLGGGMARVTLYSPLLDGVGYVLKGCDAEYQRAGGDYHEARKFGGNCDVMLSESVFHVLEGRRQIGKRRRQGQRKAE